MATTMSIRMPAAPMATLLQIAKNWLWIETFDDSLADGDDYRAVYVPRVGIALRAAYVAGFTAATGGSIAEVPEVTAVLVEIANLWLRIDTFEDRLAAQDRYDYRAVRVTRVGLALQGAYLEGFAAGKAAGVAG